MAKARYHGFSSAKYLATKESMTLTDVALVKRDLLNHIFTRRGERPMAPRFGTSIPDLVFEPLDDKTVEDVRREVEMVFNYDPRVRVIEMAVYAMPDANAIIVSAVLQYLELDAVDRLDLQIEFANQ